MEDHFVEWLPVERAHGVDLEVGHEAGLAEGVPARSVHRLDERLEADLASQVFVDLLLVIVQVRLGLRVRLAAQAARLGQALAGSRRTSLG